MKAKNPPLYFMLCTVSLLTLVSNIVICGNEYSGGGQRESCVRCVLHAFTFDLPIITIGFTFNDSVAKPIS